MVKEINYTATELKKAQAIVSDYLFTSLLQVTPGTKVRLGSLGWLVKKSRRISNGNLGPGTFCYYHCGFKKSAPLKRALDQQIENDLK